MKKSRSIIVFVISILVIVAFCLCAAMGIGPDKMGSADNIVLGLDLRGGVSITYETLEENPDSEDLQDTINKLEKRVQQYSTDATVYKEGNNRITVEIPGVYDTETVIEELGKPGSLLFLGPDAVDSTTGELDTSNPILTGDNVKEAQAATQSDQQTGSSDFVVRLVLNDEGAQAFSEATSAHIGEIIYIVYDGEIVSYPTVQTAITDGNCVIEGMGTYEKAEELASTIRIGSLKLELQEVSSKVVSAKLGNNAVSTSLLAGLIGTLAIILFLIIYYRVPGIAAALSLVFYIAAVLLLLNAFDLTLTISGIAGIILSIGMAVDGNVIINARIKEELEAGYAIEQAIKNGFKKSTSAILDGNITTLIVAVVLLIFGSGTVQGFGMTLAIGIVMSVITSLLVARLITECLFGMGLKSEKLYAVKSNKNKKPFDFVGKRIIFFAVGAVLILAGIVTMLVNGATPKRDLNYSIEFVGGVSTTVEFEKDYSIEEFNNEIKNSISEVIGSEDIEGQKVSGTTQYVIKTQDLGADVRGDMQEMLVNNYGADPESFEVTYISASVSTELIKNALISILIAAVCMLLYIWIRFRKFKFAISSVIALAHDVMIVVAFFAIFRLSVGNSFIACILTIVGYSINATIVIFDRIRENNAKSDINYDLQNVINLSIQQTLSRSIYTSATTFIMVMLLYFMGVESMRAFALPLAVGIVAGAYSSIFISGSLFFQMTKKSERLDTKRISMMEKKAAKELEAVKTETGEPEEAGDKTKEEAGQKKITANPTRKKNKKRKQ